MTSRCPGRARLLGARHSTAFLLSLPLANQSHKKEPAPCPTTFQRARGTRIRHWTILTATLSLTPPPGRAQNPPRSEVLGCFGLSIQTREVDLQDEFSKYGQVVKVVVVYDQRVSKHPIIRCSFKEGRD